MRPLRVGVDCDGVLLDWRHGFADFVRRRHGIILDDADFSHPTCDQYPTFQRLGVPAERLAQLVRDYFHRGEPRLLDPDVHAVLAEFRRDAQVTLVTRRGEHARQATLAYLRRLALVPDHACFGADDKSGYDILIDDQAHHCQQALDAGGIAIHYRQPWSGSTPRGAHPAQSWQDVRNLLGGLLASGLGLQEVAREA
jgi:hypothetical protein